MRVVAGKAKGRRLKAPRGSGARYTSDFVREALFNVLTPVIAGTRFLDLFAGVGSVGIEAASRGAGQVVMVEKDPVRLGFLVRNLRSTGLEPVCRVCRQDVFAAINMLRRHGERFDVVFLDPPYYEGLAEAAVARVASSGLLDTSGVLIAEHSRKEVLPEQVDPLLRVRRGEYGDSVLSFYRQRPMEGDRLA
jgi:16S rRNA (guanine(966)-N(2))-methyltransferase RsmD